MDLNKNILKGKELLHRLKAEDWNKLIPKLHYYSLNKLERYSFLADMYDVNNLANQIADEAIQMVWEEKRKWNLDYYQELYSFLKGIVDSLISNFINSKEVEITEAIPNGGEVVDSLSGSNPEKDLIIKEIEEEIKSILQKDDEALRVFDCLKDGLKPREISDELNWNINRVYNILKRVHRKLKEYSQIKNI